MSSNQEEKKTGSNHKNLQKPQPKPQEESPLKDLPMKEQDRILAIAAFIMRDAMKPHVEPFTWSSDSSSED